MQGASVTGRPRWFAGRLVRGASPPARVLLAWIPCHGALSHQWLQAELGAGHRSITSRVPGAVVYNTYNVHTNCRYLRIYLPLDGPGERGYAATYYIYVGQARKYVPAVGGSRYMPPPPNAPGAVSSSSRVHHDSAKSRAPGKPFWQGGPAAGGNRAGQGRTSGREDQSPARARPSKLGEDQLMHRRACFRLLSSLFETCREERPPPLPSPRAEPR